MILSLQLTAPIPSKKNSRRNFKAKNGKIISLPCEEYNKWHKANLLATKSKKGILQSDKPVNISVKLQFKDKRRRDLDNALSSVLDLLVDSGVIADDNWCNVPSMAIQGSYGDVDTACVTLEQ